jgi:hypothetical protein
MISSKGLTLRALRLLSVLAVKKDFFNNPLHDNQKIMG